MKFIKILISFFSKTLNIVGIVFLFITLASSYISPEKIAIVAVIGYLFPLAVILNVLFATFWLIRRKWFFIFSVLSLFISFSQINNIIAFKKDKSEGKGIKIMSYNVKNFDLYNWSENLLAQEKIFSTITEENPDVICFQEFYTDTTIKFNTIKKLKNLGYINYVFSKELVLRNSDEWGIATFSKYPIISSEKILKQKYKSFYGVLPYKGISTTVQYKNKNIQIINVHLQSIYFGKNDYKTITEITDIKNIDENNAISLIEKFKVAFARRAIQADELKKYLNTQKANFIVCGDFNDLPNSYTYNTISKNLKDAFIDNSVGIGVTYNGNIPFLRIDYMLCTQNVKVSDFKVVKNSISDHYPIVAYFDF